MILLPDGVLTSHRISAPKEATGWRAVLWHHADMEALLDAARLGTGDAVAAIEEYAFGIPRRKGASRHVMVEVGVMYRMALTRAGIPWVTVPRSEWAKFVAGDGSAKKQQVSARVKRRWGFEDPCEDVVEAYGIMRWLEAQQRDITNTTNGG